MMYDKFLEFVNPDRPRDNFVNMSDDIFRYISDLLSSQKVSKSELIKEIVKLDIHFNQNHKIENSNKMITKYLLEAKSSQPKAMQGFGNFTDLILREEASSDAEKALRLKYIFAIMYLHLNFGITKTP